MTKRPFCIPDYLIRDTTIVPIEEVLDDEGLLAEPEIYQCDVAFRGKDEILKWFAKRGLIKNERKCENCNSSMSFIRDKSVSDCFRWKCRKCGKRKTVRDSTFFQQSNLSLQQHITIMYMWCRGTPQKFITHEARMTPSGESTLGDYCHLCREICAEDLLKNLATIGGLDEDCHAKVVEIDETYFYPRKRSCTNSKEGRWVFGGIERDTGRCFMTPIPDRSAETLLPLIERYILPETIIISGSRDAYRGIGKLNDKAYKHETVMIGKCISDSVHIRNIRKLFLHVRNNLRVQLGSSKKLLESYLSEFAWRSNCQNEKVFQKFLVSIRQQYKLSS